MRCEFNCEKLLYYYLCRYSYKYCSEIIYALQKVNLTKYKHFNILSLGCGGAADLMAFDYLYADDQIYYNGVDLNTCWNNIHSKIKKLYRNSSFKTNFNVKRDMHLLNKKK